MDETRNSVPLAAIGSDIAARMTHWPQERPEPYVPNPQLLVDIGNFARGGVQGVIKGRGGPEILPDWLTAALDNPDFQLAMGAAGPAGAARWIWKPDRVAKALEDFLGASEPRASRGLSIYNPPAKPPRPFAADYPQGASGDVAGRLTHDVEGRPLTAPFIAGRTEVGGVDVPARTASQYNALSTLGTGRPASQAAAKEMGSDYGITRIPEVPRVTAEGKLWYPPEEIVLRKGMPPEKESMVYAHELGHVIDEIAGRIPTKGLSEELKGVYNTLNNPNRTKGGLEAALWGPRYRPQDLGYEGEEIPREHAAEAVRAYMTDPNYLKTVAPRTAARIREAVNSDPQLSKIIQFNALPVAAGIGASAPEVFSKGAPSESLGDILNNARLPPEL